MLTHIARLTGLTALLAVLIAPSAHAAQFRVGVQIGRPAPVVVAQPPVYGSYGAPGYIWQPGYYVWTGYGRRWVPGVWVLRGHVPNGRAYGYWRNRGWDRDREFDRDRRGWDRDDRRWRR